jgi:hypothetical protein
MSGGTDVFPWDRFLLFSRWALDGLLWAWPVTLILVCGVAGGLVLATRRGGPIVWRSFAAQVLLLLVPVATLVLGSVYACENCSPSSLGQGVRHYAALRVVNVLFVLQLAWAGWFVYSSRGARIVALFWQALFVWCTLCAGFIAGMSISGDWL